MMIPRRTLQARRVILVVADGLRPDIIPLLDLPTLGRLVRQGASTLHGRTVRPSVTAAAMASLLTGVEPEVHGLASSRFRVPRPVAPSIPCRRCSATAGSQHNGVHGRLPWAYRRLGTMLARRLGFGHVSFEGDSADEILAAAA